MSLNRIRRRALDLFFRAARESCVFLKGKKQIKNLVYFPLITEINSLSDILNRANWYFPEKSSSEAVLTIPVEKFLYKKTDFAKLYSPESQENFIKKNNRIKIVPADKNSLNKIASGSDAILLWDFNSFYSVPGFIFNLDKIWVVDPNYFLVTEARNYIWLRNQTIPKSKLLAMLEQSQKNFKNLIAEAGKSKEAYVFGTGPSVINAKNFDFSAGFSIVTNTMINDDSLMARIKPKAIVFGDFIYHMGASIYAASFRKQLMEKFGSMYGLIRFDILPLLLDHYPNIEKKLVALPMKLFAGPNIPTPENFYLNLSNNSLVGYMLPIASAAVNKINVIGCDGRKPDDELFWSHAKTVHYDDLTKTLVQTHPSVYRDTDFTVYYSETISDVAAFMNHGESKGKKYLCLTPSYIPALAKRQKN